MNSRIRSVPKLDQWMKYLSPELKDMPLTHLAIPGSHDSMTYNIPYKRSSLGPDADSAIKTIHAIHGGSVVNWAKTQNLNTWEQLFAGIRFFDLRVATQPSSNRFYFTHALLAGEIYEPLNDVKDFVDSHPEEVVILYFQHFYNFTYEDHTRLVDYLLRLFGPRLVPQPVNDIIYNITIHMLARLNQSIILVYRNNVVLSYTQLWYPRMLRAPWPQVQTTDELLSYFHHTIRIPRRLHVHQAVLTPSGDFIAKRIFSNLLEECARPVLRDVLPVIASEFFPGPVKNLGDGIAPINVVVADFIDLENNLFPRTIITLNKKIKTMKIKNIGR